MAYELITSSSDYQQAIDRLLAMATRSICIYDEDLAALRLDSPIRQAELQRFAQRSPKNSCRIALRNASHFQRDHPLLLRLMASHGAVFSAQQTPMQLAHLRDAMVLVDGQHGLIRFDREQARSKILLDEAAQIAPYEARFEQIWKEGGELLAISTLGL